MNWKERRRYERVPFSADLTVENLASGHRWKGHSINLSIGGMGFYSERFLETRTPIRLYIWFNRSGKNTPIRLAATVRWAQPEASGGVMGAEFDALISHDNQPALYEFLNDQ